MLDEKRQLAYLEKSKNDPPSSWLPDAIKEIKSGAKVALDLGCGAGRDTKYLLEQGFKVTAVDGSPLAAKYLAALPHQERLIFLASSFKDFNFPLDEYDLVNAQYSLPYAERDYFADVFSRMEKSLKKGGVFVGQLFGAKDDWFKSPTSLTKFHTEEEARDLFANWDVVAFDPFEYESKLDNGTMKHWHTFHVLARKN